MFTKCGHYIFQNVCPPRPSALLAGIMFWKCPPFAEERLCTIMLPPTTLKKIEHFFTQGAMLETMSITGIRTCMRPSKNRANSDDAHGQE